MPILPLRDLSIRSSAILPIRRDRCPILNEIPRRWPGLWPDIRPYRRSTSEWQGYSGCWCHLRFWVFWTWGQLAALLLRFAWGSVSAITWICPRRRITVGGSGGWGWRFIGGLWRGSCRSGCVSRKRERPVLEKSKLHCPACWTWKCSTRPLISASLGNELAYGIVCPISYREIAILALLGSKTWLRSVSSILYCTSIFPSILVKVSEFVSNRNHRAAYPLKWKFVLMFPYWWSKIVLFPICNFGPICWRCDSFTLLFAHGPISPVRLQLRFCDSLTLLFWTS